MKRNSESLDERAVVVSRHLDSIANSHRAQRVIEQRWSEQLEKDTHELADETAIVDAEERVHAILLELETLWRKDFERSVERVISEGLSLVFDEELVFHITAAVKGGSSAVTFELEGPSGFTDIMNAEGGSVVQVVSFLLRVLLVLAHKPALRRTIILDEAFAGMSEKNVPKLAALLRKMVDETGIQLIMVTHDPTYGEQADAVYEVKRKRGVGEVVAR